MTVLMDGLYLELYIDLIHKQFIYVCFSSQFSYDRDVSVFRCDCSTLWLHEWMNSRPLLSSVKCGSPPQFAGLDIRTLQTASFGCGRCTVGGWCGRSVSVYIQLVAVMYITQN